MSRQHASFQNPFRGLAESATTSNVIDTRLTFDVTLSWRTTSGTTSTTTYQLSNGDGLRNTQAIPETSWSDWTVFGNTGVSGQPSLVTTLDPPLGYRWARILRENSGASFEVFMNLQFRD